MSAETPDDSRAPGRRGGIRDSTRGTAGGDPAQPQTVTIPLEQLQTFTSVQARLAQMEADQRSRDEAARAEQVKLLAQKGEIENALRIQREEGQKQLDSERASRSAVEERAKRYALDGEVSRVLASQPLVPGGAEQLTQLWRNQFVVEPQGDSLHGPYPDVSIGRRLRRGPARPTRICPLRSRIKPRRRDCRHDRRTPGRADVAGEPGCSDSAQELWRGDHPADAGDSEDSALRSTAEPGRRHGPQFEVDGSSSVIIFVRGQLSVVRCENRPSAARGRYRCLQLTTDNSKMPFEGKPAVARSATRTANAAHGELPVLSRELRVKGRLRSCSQRTTDH